MLAERRPQAGLAYLPEIDLYPIDRPRAHRTNRAPADPGIRRL